MASDGPTPAPDAANHNDWRRQDKRHRTNCLTCNMGEVVDLSQRGMRIDLQGRPPMKVGEVGSFILHSPEGDLTLTGRTAWVRRKGIRKYEMGIEFIKVRRAIAAALESLACFGFLGTDRYVHQRGEASPTPQGDLPDRDSPARNLDHLSQLVDSSLRRIGVKPGSGGTQGPP